MATSFGGGEGAPDLKKVVTNPVVLGAAALAIIIAVFVSRRTMARKQPTGAATSYGVQPGSTGADQSADQFGLAVGGMQNQLGNLVAQWSAGIQGIQNQLQNQQNPPTSFSAPSNPPDIAGAVPGSDVGWFHGAIPTNLPPGAEVQWRWTSWFINQNRQTYPWLNPNPAEFTGYEFFSNVPGLGPAPPYSWEYRVIQHPGGGASGSALGLGSSSSGQFLGNLPPQPGIGTSGVFGVNSVSGLR